MIFNRAQTLGQQFLLGRRTLPVLAWGDRAGGSDMYRVSGPRLHQNQSGSETDTDKDTDTDTDTGTETETDTDTDNLCWVIPPGRLSAVGLLCVMHVQVRV